MAGGLFDTHTSNSDACYSICSTYIKNAQPAESNANAFISF